MVDQRRMQQSVQREVSQRPSRVAAQKAQDLAKRVEALEEKLGKLTAQVDQQKASASRKRKEDEQ